LSDKFNFVIFFGRSCGILVKLRALHSASAFEITHGPS
jgi:hypothetical protein